MQGKIRLKVVSRTGEVRAASDNGERVSLVYPNEYENGDYITLESDRPGLFYMVQFEDTLPYALIYAPRTEMVYRIPFGEDRIVFSPRSFTGTRHLIRARLAAREELAVRRCLSMNPYDRHGEDGFFPHASANVETRGESVFAAYNAIDGMFENTSHGAWPYQSWGINRDPDARWRLDFGRPVLIDEIRMTLRADFPHDNYWTRATVAFSDGSSEVLPLIKTAEPQPFPLVPRTVEWLVLKDLVQAEGESPFPALTQLEAWGCEPVFSSAKENKTAR